MKSHLIRSINRISRQVQGQVARSLVDTPIGAGQQAFFMALRKDTGPSQEDLSREIGVDKAATARALQTLEAKGLVHRLPDPKDKRQKQIYLTDKAKAIAAKLEGQVDQVRQDLFRGFSQQDLDQLASLLARLEANLQTMQRRDS